MKTTRLLTVIASLLAATIACTASAGEKREACCQVEVKNAPFSPRSLYQLEATYTDTNGREITLAAFRGRPVVLTMFFASCGYACPLLVSDMTQLRELLPADIRDQAALVLVSFDIERDTPEALKKYKTDRLLDDQWTLLHGNDDAVSELAALLGVKYKLESNGMFSHSNLITILNPEGEIVHQRQGLKGGLEDTARAIVATIETK